MYIVYNILHIHADAQVFRIRLGADLPGVDLPLAQSCRKRIET